MADGTSKTEGENSDNGQGIRSVEVPAPQKRGRGRPPGTGNKPKPAGETKQGKGLVILPSKKPVVSPSNKSAPTPNDLESAKFIGYGAVSLLEMVESAVHNKAHGKIAKKRPHKIPEFEAILKEYALQPQEKAVIGESVTKIALRHEWLTKFAPEVVLGIYLAKYSVRQMQLLRFVENMTRDEKPPEKPAAQESKKDA